MEKSEDLRIRLGLPPVSQIGIVVKDADRAVDFYFEIIWRSWIEDRK